MTVKDLIERLTKVEDLDRICVVCDKRGGWSNIDYIEEPNPYQDSCIKIVHEEYPLFSDS